MHDIIELQKVKRCGLVLLEPVQSKDSSVFRHCTFGNIAITNKSYNKKYRPIFKLHHLIVHIIDRTRNPKYSEVE